MKFSEMQYSRPDLVAAIQQYQTLTDQLKAASSYAEAREVFLRKETFEKHLTTQVTLAEIRHTIDTRDAFYDGEVKFFNEANPRLEEYAQAWTQAMLDSPFRADFSRDTAT